MASLCHESWLDHGATNKLYFDIKLLESSVTRGRGSVSGWVDEAETIRREIQGVQDRWRKDDLNNKLARVVEMIRERDIQSDIRALKFLITSGRGTISEWMDKAGAIRREIQEVGDRRRKDNLNGKLACVVKKFREGDILNDIWELESCVSSGRGTVSGWMDEAEAIRRRIQEVWDRRRKDCLNHRLAHVVEMIRERDPVEIGIQALECCINSGRGSVRRWMDTAETISGRIQEVRDGWRKDNLNDKLARVIKKFREGDILTNIWALEFSVNSRRGSASDWMNEAEAIRRKIQGVRNRSNLFMIGLSDGARKDDLNDKLARVIKKFKNGAKTYILSDIWKLEFFVTRGRGSDSDWMDEAETIKRRIQGVGDDSNLFMIGLSDRARKDDLNDKLAHVIMKFKNGDILTNIWALQSSITSGRGTSSDWMDEAEAIRRRIHGLWRVWDGGMKDVFSDRLKRVVQMVRERDSVDHAIWSLESSVTRGRGSVSAWMDEAQTLRRRIHGIQGDTMRSNLNNNLEHVVNMIREREHEKQSIQEGIAAFQSDATYKNSPVTAWEEQVASIREKIRMFQPDGDKEELNNELSTGIRECVKVKSDSVVEDTRLLRSRVGSTEGTICDWVGHLEGIQKAVQELRPWKQYDSDKKRNLDGEITRVMEMIRERVNNMTGSVKEKLGLLQSQVYSMEVTIIEWVAKLEGIEKDVEELDSWYQYDNDYSKRKSDLDRELTRVAEIIKDRENEKKSIQEGIEAFLLDTSSGSCRLREWEAQVAAIRGKIRVFKPEGDKRELNNELSTTIRERVKLKDATKLLMFEVTSGYSTISDWIESAEVIWNRGQRLDQEREGSKLERELSWVTEEIRKQADLTGSVGDIVRLLRLDVTRGNGTINQWNDRAGKVKKKIRRLDSWEERNKEDNELYVVMVMIRQRALRSVEHSMELLLCDVASGSGSSDEWKYRAEVVKEMIQELGFSAKIKGELEGKLSRILSIINKRDSTLHLVEDRQLLKNAILLFLAFLWSLYLRTNDTGSLLGKRSASVWQVILLRSGDVESNPGPNKFTIVMAFVSSLLVHALALLGRTECQLRSSSTGREWLEVHCSAADSTSGGDGHIICYRNSYLHPSIKEPIYEGGVVNVVFVLRLPSKIHCCSDNGTAVGADKCLDFVDENPTPPPTTRSPLTSASSTLSSTSPQAMSTPVSSWSPGSSTTGLDGSRDMTQGVSTTSVIAYSVLGTLAAVVIILGVVAVTFPKQIISMCNEIERWKGCHKREDCSVDAEQGEVAAQIDPMIEV